MKNQADVARIKRVPAQLELSNLFIPGYCKNPDEDVPELNIRVFEVASRARKPSFSATWDLVAAIR